MLERAISARFTQWKNKKDHKCLLVRGARQVGKTFSIRKFGESAYDSLAEINFLENPSLMRIFSGDLDPDTLLLNLSLYMPAVKLIPGKTLLFLDEIQECPEAITSLKFWREDGRFDVVASGSILGVDYKRPTSFPVGSLDYLDMYSLNFREFLTAMNVSDDIQKKLEEHFNSRTPVPEGLHTRLIELLRKYMIIGGMPEAVVAFRQHNSIKAADEKLRSILNDYRFDIAHYAKPDIKLKAENCYFSLPKQLGRENHKFQYSVVEKGGTARKYGSSLDWLEGAFLVRKCRNVSKPALPLENYQDDSCFRIYPSDIGLLVAMFDYSVKENLLELGESKSRMEAKGGIYEALVADILMKNGHEKLYYRKNEQATLEVEFLLQTAQGIVPLEVKAGKCRSRSLDTILKNEEIPFGYKLTSGNLGVEGKKITLPLYMCMFL